MIRYFFLIILCICSLSLKSQELSVKSFSLAQSDLSAQTSPRKDNNDTNCALVKVQLVGDISNIEGNVIKPWVKKDNETWVYMTQRSRQMQIKTKEYLPLMVNFADYGISGLESNRTYTLVLTRPNDSQSQSDAGGNFYVLTVTPNNAVVTIDGKQQEVSADGQYSAMLPYGEHTYKVEAGGCIGKEGTFTVSSGEMRPMTVSLVSAMASVSVTCPTSGVSFYVDKKLVGNSPWKGVLKEGMHLIEAKKEGYRSQQKTIQLAQQQKLDVTLDALVAIQGSLSVNYKPFGSDIYIDGSLVGQSPRVFNNILVGNHDLEIKKSGYTPASKKITVVEGQMATFSGSLTQDIQSFTVNGVTFEMICVLGGTYKMGATSEQGGDAIDSEYPVHQVTLNSYYIGKYEVTQALWNAVTGSAQSYFKGNNLPIEMVSWEDCQEFIKKLNTYTGKSFRLPTEAEWEYAARGGNKSKGYIYSGGNIIDDVAWYDVNSSEKTHSVGTKSPNELGIYDMTGNVWEWCSDWFGIYNDSSQINPEGPSKGSGRILRGGAYTDYAKRCRISRRNLNTPDRRYVNVGLRLVLSE